MQPAKVLIGSMSTSSGETSFRFCRAPHAGATAYPRSPWWTARASSQPTEKRRASDASPLSSLLGISHRTQCIIDISHRTANSGQSSIHSTIFFTVRALPEVAEPDAERATSSGHVGFKRNAWPGWAAVVEPMQRRDKPDHPPAATTSCKTRSRLCLKRADHNSAKLLRRLKLCLLHCC